jgi:4-amino-4-deoxy-L-arabinose transferase-like glycosyltransferase
MTLRHPWVLPLLPTAAMLLIAVALVPVAATGTNEGVWLLAVLGAATLLAAVVALGAGRLSGEPAARPWTIAIVTGIVTAATPFAVSGLLGGPMNAVIVVPWLIFGLGAAYWQLSLCEGVRSRPLHAAIGFGYTVVFTATTLFLAVISAQLID